MIHVLGFDPSTDGAAWALLRVNHNHREYIAHGECSTEESLIERIREHVELDSKRFEEQGIIGVEIVADFGSKGTNEFGARARAKMLLRTQATAHFIRGYATGRGLHVEALPSYAADRHLGLRGAVTDAMVARALRVIVPTWPKAPKTNEHHRDAGAVAFAAAQRFGVTHGWSASEPRVREVTRSVGPEVFGG